MARPAPTPRALAAYRRATWTAGALVVVVVAVVIGVLAVAGPSSGSGGTSAMVSSSQQLADLFAEDVPAEEAVGAIGSDAVSALEGVRPIVEVVDAASDLLPRYVVGSAEPGDGDAWEVQQAVQRGGSLELVVPADDADRSVLRIIRTSTEDPPPAPEAPTTTVTAASPTTTDTTETTSTTEPSTAPTTATTVTTEPSTPDPVVTPPPSTPPDAPGPTPGEPGESTHQVAPGESFWSVAETMLAERLGGAPSEAEVTAYWHALVQLNRHQLPDPGNADLIVPGMVLTLPTD